MPRPRKHALFELAGQWIAPDPASRNLYRFWNDERTGRTRRESLGTADLERAKTRFAEIVVAGRAKTANDYLSIVLESYFESRTDALPSADQARFAGAALIAAFGELVRVNGIDVAKQRAFCEWSIGRRHSLGYASRNLSVLAAALEHAKIPHQVVVDEASILAAWPDLQWKPERTVFIPSDAELARFFEAEMPDNLFRWAIMACLTAGRPEAINELTPAQRIRDAGLLDLNPPGRRQNKKYRPIVREPKALSAWLDKWEEGGLDTTGGHYCGYDSREGLKTALQRVRTADGVDLPRLTLRSFRHKVKTVLQLSGVSDDEIAWQFGHKRPNLRVTEQYGERQPNYLKGSATALDQWWRRLQSMTDRSLYATGIPKGLRIKSGRKAA